MFIGQIITLTLIYRMYNMFMALEHMQHQFQLLISQKADGVLGSEMHL